MRAVPCRVMVSTGPGWAVMMTADRVVTSLAPSAATSSDGLADLSHVLYSCGRESTSAWAVPGAELLSWITSDLREIWPEMAVLVVLADDDRPGYRLPVPRSVGEYAPSALDSVLWIAQNRQVSDYGAKEIAVGTLPWPPRDRVGIASLLEDQTIRALFVGSCHIGRVDVAPLLALPSLYEKEEFLTLSARVDVVRSLDVALISPVSIVEDDFVCIRVVCRNSIVSRLPGTD